MVISVVAHGVQREMNRLVALDVRVAHISRVVPVLHPDCLVENDIAQPENRSGDVAIKDKLLDMDEAAGVDLAIRILVRSEIIGAIAHGYFFVDVVEENCTLDGRAQGRDQIAVIPASVNPRDCGGGIPAQTVGNQPLFVERLVKVYAGFAWYL
jgi:hypothetical protein